MWGLVKAPDLEIPPNWLPPKLNVRGIENVGESKVFTDPEGDLYGVEKIRERNALVVPEPNLFVLNWFALNALMLEGFALNLLAFNRLTLDDVMFEGFTLNLLTLDDAILALLVVMPLLFSADIFARSTAAKFTPLVPEKFLNEFVSQGLRPWKPFCHHHA